MLHVSSLNEEIRRVTINGRDFDLDVARNKLLPVVRGAAEGDPPEPPPPPPPPAPDPAAPDLTALQAEIDRAKASGTSEATSSLLKALGFDKLEDAQAFVTAKREADKAQMTELEQREAAAVERETAAQDREAEAKKLIESGVIRLALSSAGVDAKVLVDAEGIARSRITGDITEETAKTTAEAMKAEPAFASFFTGTPASGGPAPSPGQPKPPRSQGAPDPLAAGKARAETMRKNRAGATKEDLINDFGPKPSPFANSVT